ncbi:hypothetical protein I3843_10G084500 [Carya illinoinensis]|uniref:DNA replication complex GINS protein SLD5 C-terminal domain-containing protein n=1 Tax=Carya illinoinensis TaxID=32201 RepID=A0A922DWS6_CARIL|nr:hypothetical protein I3842_10G086500 [Carya illinoinensis]KAG7959740.1 hypothetical protein I3843_10G084500 [Carya illinoinensis]KAG7959741.1 hypothetical protein I3843_10G084500 [Carya illinoinensis]
MESNLEQTGRQMTECVKVKAAGKSKKKNGSILLDWRLLSEPHLDPFVVCKSRRFLGPFQLDGSDELLEMKPDDLCIIHYKSIRERVQEGEIDLV